MTDEARKLRNAYKREWYKQHPEKRKEHQERYWQRKANSNRRETAGNGAKGERQ